MSEPLSKKIERLEEMSTQTVQKIRKVSDKVSKELREEFHERIDDGRKLIKQIDDHLDKTEDKTKDSYHILRKQAKRTVDELIEAWKETGEEPVIEYYE